MTQATTPQRSESSRLIRCLRELGVLDTAGSQTAFPGQLASVIDFAASIRLATALAQQERAAAPSAAPAAESPRDLFLRLRSGIIRPLLAGFAPKPGYTHLRLPALEPMVPEDESAAFAPYLRFYAGQQRMMETKVLNLHLQIRDATAMLSPRLAQLCELDKILGDTLAQHARKAYGDVPRLLQQRFRGLLEQCRRQQASPGDGAASWVRWQRQFHSDLRETLLAELDARLLPTLGLVEASNPTAPPAAINARRESKSP
jgi:hypothetical protein